MEPIEETQKRLDGLSLKLEKNLVSTSRRNSAQFLRVLSKQFSISYREENISEQIDEHFSKSLKSTIKEFHRNHSFNHDHGNYKPKRSWLRQYGRLDMNSNNSKCKLGCRTNDKGPDDEQLEETRTNPELISPTYSLTTSGFFSNSNLSLDSFMGDINDDANIYHRKGTKMRKRAASVASPTVGSKRSHF